MASLNFDDSRSTEAIATKLKTYRRHAEPSGFIAQISGAHASIRHLIKHLAILKTGEPILKSSQKVHKIVSA